MSDADFAIEYACAKRMHQSFTIPGTETQKPLKVTYAIGGLENDDAPTVVLISGMYGMRWIALLQHHLALKAGVRLVCVDRPSFGGSTPVPLSERISTWLYTVPHLLAHLNCKYIVPIAASAGTIYLLNTVWRFPSILPPNAPYSAVLAPWVHPKHSNSAMMSFVASDWMPKFLIEKQWDNVSGFVATKLVPSFAASGGFMEMLGGASSGLASSKTNQQKEDDDDDVKSMEAYGMTRSRKDAVEKLCLKYMFAEETSGANDEALLCLKKGTEADVGWGECDDYGSFVPKLAEKWKDFEGEEGRSGVKLRVHAYFATSDVMIGEGGKKYIEECWGMERCGDGIEFVGSATEDTTHDSIGRPESGILEGVFREAKSALEMTSISNR